MRQSFAHIALSPDSLTHMEGEGEEREFDYSTSYFQKRCSIIINSIAKGPMPQSIIGINCSYVQRPGEENLQRNH